MSGKEMDENKEQVNNQELLAENKNDPNESPKGKVGRRKQTIGLEGKTEAELKELACQGYYVRDAVKDRVYCPRGIILRRKSVKKDGTIRYSNKLECRRCGQREKCTVAPFKIVEFRDGQEYSLCKKWNEPEE